MADGFQDLTLVVEVGVGAVSLLGGLTGAFLARRNPLAQVCLTALFGALFGLALGAGLVAFIHSAFLQVVNEEQGDFPHVDITLPVRSPGQVYWLFYDGKQPTPPLQQGRLRLLMPPSGGLVIGGNGQNLSPELYTRDLRVFDPSGKRITEVVSQGGSCGSSVRYVVLVVCRDSNDFSRAVEAQPKPEAVYARLLR